RLTVETCPANLPPYIPREMQELAAKQHKLLQLRFYSRIDFMMDRDNNIYFLEANSLPGMTPVSLLPQEAAADGIEYEELCSIIAQSAF
ncbi:MAG: D-alanine--D-alanine ligase, partial [Eubacterium sp.]|nr:D-alanine--D-alanine ligase [Eubacterium sp.]